MTSNPSRPTAGGLTALSAALGKLDMTPAITAALGRLDMTPAISAALGVLEQRTVIAGIGVYLETLDSRDVAEVIERVGDTLEEAELEQMGQEDRPVDPFVEALLRKTANFTSQKFQRYSDAATRGANRLAIELVVQALVTAVPTVLIALLGPVGIGLSVFALGLATAVSKERKEAMSSETRNGLDIPCPTCGAVVDLWCVTIRGEAPGSKARNLHKSRLQRA